MIVNIKLSVSDQSLGTVLYHAEALQAIANSNSPGYIYLDFNGLKGKTHSSSHSKYAHRKQTKCNQAEPLELTIESSSR